MKIKFMLGLVVAAVIASPVMALQVTKGKVIKHQEWSTKGVKASYLNSVSKQIRSHGDVYVSSGVRPVQVAVGEAATINNDSYLYVRNDSHRSHTYYLTSNVCVWLDDKNQECVYARDTVAVESGGAVFESRGPALTVSLPQSGEYFVQGESYVFDTSGDRASYARANSTLTVN